jgi:hypothetical protein
MRSFASTSLGNQSLNINPLCQSLRRMRVPHSVRARGSHLFCRGRAVGCDQPGRLHEETPHIGSDRTPTNSLLCRLFRISSDVGVLDESQRAFVHYSTGSTDKRLHQQSSCGRSGAHWCAERVQWATCGRIREAHHDSARNLPTAKSAFPDGNNELVSPTIKHKINRESGCT